MGAAAPAGPARLLVVSSYFDTHKGGLEIVAGRLAEELAMRGFSVSWLATSAVAPSASARVRTQSVGAWNVAERRLGIPFPIPSPRALTQVWREVRQADAVLLHDSLYPLSMATTLAARLTSTPLLILQHIGQVRYKNALPRTLMAIANRLVARPVLSCADQVVFISHFVRDFFADVGFRKPAEVIFNGVDTEIFAPGDQAAARAVLNIATDAKLVLFVGRFVEKKGLHLLRQAAQSRPTVLFAFAGWGHLDPSAWDLANVRVFAGRHGASLAQLYQAADLFALPSVGEGFPLVVQEAMACGLPVICGMESTTADPAATEHLIGVEIEGPGADNRLVAAIDQALATPDDPLAVQARSTLVLQRYGWPTGADAYARLLSSLIATSRAKRADVHRASLHSESS